MSEAVSPSNAQPSVPDASPPLPPPVVARAGRYYRNARFVMALGLAIMGGYFAYDGYKGYPELNRRIAAVAAEINATPTGSARWIELDQLRTTLGSPKNDAAIGLQKKLGFALPLAAVAYVAFFLRKSRGEIRLDGDTLSVPGHPAVPLGAIRSVDSRLWKKKGIAVVRYDAAGRAGAITLDDFVYQQTPIDAIYERIVAHQEVALKPGPLKATPVDADAHD